MIGVCDIFARQTGAQKAAVGPLRHASRAKAAADDATFVGTRGAPHNGVCAVLASWFCVSSSKINFSSFNRDFRLSFECRVNLSLVPNKLRAVSTSERSSAFQWGNRGNFETQASEPRIAAVWGRSAPRSRLNLGDRWERAELTLNANLAALTVLLQSNRCRALSFAGRPRLIPFLADAMRVHRKSRLNCGQLSNSRANFYFCG